MKAVEHREFYGLSCGCALTRGRPMRSGVNVALLRPGNVLTGGNAFLTVVACSASYKRYSSIAEGVVCVGHGHHKQGRSGLTSSPHQQHHRWRAIARRGSAFCLSHQAQTCKGTFAALNGPQLSEPLGQQSRLSLRYVVLCCTPSTELTNIYLCTRARRETRLVKDILSCSKSAP